MNTNLIQHLHAFRGLAILCIVCAHAWSFMIFQTGGLDSQSLTYFFYLTETLFHGSTLYFAVISGLLYSLVLRHKSWRHFFISKGRNVLLPYFIISAFLIVLYSLFNSQFKSGSNLLWTWLWGLPFGEAAVHFWYMPVLFVLFLLTPLLACLVEQPNYKWLVWGLMLMPLVISRSTFPDFLKVQSVFYFIGAYVVGIYTGKYYDKALVFINLHFRFIVISAIAISCIIFSTYLLNYEREGFYSVRQSFYYLQKLLFCALAFHWLKTIELRLPKFLMLLGSFSFAIYFIHMVFIDAIIAQLTSLLTVNHTTDLIFIFGVINIIIALIGSLIIAKAVKQVFGHYSRSIIGA